MNQPVKIKATLLLGWMLLVNSADAATSPADKQKLTDALLLFQKGAYAQAIERAKEVKGKDQETAGALAFFLASTYSKMQAFDEAIPYFAKAEKLNHSAESLHYDYGQALFASQKLKEAEAQFKKSILKNFKVGASAYYVGFIRQIFEDNVGARDFYFRIQKLSQDPDRVKQPSLFQVAEIESDRVAKEENKNKRLAALKGQVLPLYEKARDFASGTATHDQAVAKIKTIEAELAQVVERMRNGIPLPKKPYSATVTQDIAYDSNVITRADEAVTQVSDKDSFLSKTSLKALYQFNWRRTFSFIPELSASANLHSRRSSPQVYQNDNLSFTPALRAKFEHMSRGNPATTLFDVEFNLMLRDYNQAHKFPFYSRYWNYTLGERVKWFDTGTTTLKVSVKFFENYNPERNSITTTLSLTQNIRVYKSWDLSSTLSGDYLRARNDVNDEKNYKLNSSIVMTDLIGEFDVTPSLTLNIKDTMKQKGTRGNEFLLNPTLAVAYDFSSQLAGGFEYGYSKNYSKAKDTYQYTKHEFKVGVSHRF